MQISKVINSNKKVANLGNTLLEKTTSISRLDKLFEQNGFIKTDRDCFQKELSGAKCAQLTEKFGATNAAKYMKAFLKPVTKEERLDFKKFLELNDGCGLKEINKNFDEIFATFRVLVQNSFGRLNEFFESAKKYGGLTESILNIAKNPAKECEIKSFNEYKSAKFYAINNALRGNPIFNAGKTKMHIDNIRNYINTQTINSPLKVYRGEGFEVLEKVKLKDGSSVNLAKMMIKARESGDINKINKVKEFILDNEITATQKSFMSASTEKENAHFFSKGKNIMWELDVKPKTKAVFVEGINPSGNFSNEREFLFQNGSNLKILNAELDPQSKIWYLKGEVSN